MEEIWKDIQDFEGYQVSNLGRIRSFRQGAQGRVLCQINTTKGYAKINLYREGQMVTLLIHRLVAQAFLPNPNQLPEVNHKDRNPSNNCVENLEWCDRTYNNNYDGRVERQARAQGHAILCIETGEYYDSAASAGRALNITPRLIRGVLYGEHHTTHGLHFVYTTKKEEQ